MQKKIIWFSVVLIHILFLLQVKKAKATGRSVKRLSSTPTELEARELIKASRRKGQVAPSNDNEDKENSLAEIPRLSDLHVPAKQYFKEETNQDKVNVTSFLNFGIFAAILSGIGRNKFRR